MTELATILTLAAMLVFGGMGDLFLSHGMRVFGQVPPRPLGRFLRRVWQAFRRRWVLAGFLCTVAYFLLYLGALTWIDVSVVVPVSSGTYVLTTLGARFLLREQVSRRRWLGTLLVMAGVCLVVWSQSG